MVNIQDDFEQNQLFKETTLITDKKRLFSNGKAAKELGIKLFDREKLYKLFENVFLDVSN